MRGASWRGALFNAVVICEGVTYVADPSLLGACPQRTDVESTIVNAAGYAISLNKARFPLRKTQAQSITEENLSM